MLRNKPETIIDSRTGAKRRIEYTVGLKSLAVAILFIEG
jgi:hypothetical protein